MRRGFTLVELLVVVAVVAAMLGAAVLNVASGTQSARLRNAVRSVKQYARHARAMALIRQRPYVVTVSEVWNGGDFLKTRLEVQGSGNAAGGGAARGRSAMMDVTGKYVGGDEGDDASAASPLANLGEDPKEFEGVRVKVEMLADDGRSKRSGMSMFSNVSFLQGSGGNTSQTLESQDDDSSSSSEEARDPVSIIYETNGRCRPHLVTVYVEGQDADAGRKIRFDRFGGIHEGKDEK